MKKKAKSFDSKIETVKPTIAFASLKLAQLSENSLLHSIVQELDGRESFVDVDSSLDEKVYIADVFDAILGEDAESPKLRPKDIAQLEELSDAMVDFDYFVLVKSL